MEKLNRGILSSGDFLGAFYPRGIFWGDSVPGGFYSPSNFLRGILSAGDFFRTRCLHGICMHCSCRKLPILRNSRWQLFVRGLYVLRIKDCFPGSQNFAWVKFHGIPPSRELNFTMDPIRHPAPHAHGERPFGLNEFKGFQSHTGWHTPFTQTTPVSRVNAGN